jgi:hypothetical protein
MSKIYYTDDELKIFLVTYTFLFAFFLSIFYPLVETICTNLDVPFDLTLSVMSMGFGNELILLFSLLSLALFHIIISLLIKLICKIFI